LRRTRISRCNAPLPLSHRLGALVAKPQRRRCQVQRLHGGYGQRAYSSCRCWVKRQISPQGLR
jgi:hypothetical protein